MFIMPEIIAIDILNLLFFIFASIAFVMSIGIVFGYDKNATTPKQYTLEKQSYLASTIIKYIFIIKVPLFLFFIFVLDKLSFVIPGAMCGAGVINSNDFGIALILLKIVNIYLFAYWIVLDAQDMSKENQPYMREKFILFLLLFLLLVIEIALESDFFYSIDIKKIVNCCGAIFSTTEGSYLSEVLSLSPAILLTLFYGTFILMVVMRFFQQKYLFSVLNILFVIISLISLISFFGTYIYELPSHHCPFCMLQSDYHYIGYVLYLFLFLGTFNGTVLGLIEFDDATTSKRYNSSLLFNSFYVLIVSYYVLSFYLRNGVWL